MSRFEPKVRWWSATTRSLSQFALARRPQARRRLSLECLEDRTLLSTIALAVTTLLDDPTGVPISGYTTLRDAITQADNDPANSYAINFSVAVPGTIGLTSSLPDLSNNIALNGPGSSNLTVQRFFSITAPDFSVFTVDSGATVSLSGMTITGGNAGNDNGGGIDNSGTLAVSNSVFASNSATNGGGIANEIGATLTVTNSTFITNSASAFSGIINSNGGGIYNAGTATVSDSTFSYDFALSGKGGGLYNSGTVTLTNCTFGVSAAGYGGGLSNSDGTATLTDCTVSGNTSQDGGGIANGGGSLLLNNTIVAGNFSTGTSTNDISGQVNPTSAYNLIGDGSGIANLPNIEEPALSNLIGTTANRLNPLLGPLADNGGPTQTMILQFGSPATDAGSVALAVDPTTGQPLTYDQRGVGFPRVINGTVDIGAIENQGLALVVNTLTDDPNGPIPGYTTLRDAITQANSVTTATPANPFVISFSVMGTIDLTSPLPALNNNINLNVPGAWDLTVQSVFTVDSGAVVSFSGMTIAGGGIANYGTATVINSTLSGGGIANYGTATVINSTITGSYDCGLNNYGTATVTDSTFSDNSTPVDGAGGGIYNDGGTLMVSGSTFTGNSATFGGGIANLGTATVINSTFTGNSAYGGFGTGLVYGGYGGGIFVLGGSVMLTNCTVSGNNVTLLAAGVGVVSSGGGGGIANEDVAIEFNNTIVAGNTGTETTYTGTETSENDLYGTVQPTSAFNLIGDGSGISNLTDLEEPALSNLIGTTADPINPLLAPLADYGGPTQTMALLPGSPAIDAGSNALAVDANGNPLTTDQRGPGFPRIVNGTVDIGAFESQGFTLTPVTGSTPQGTPVNSPFANPLAVIVTANSPLEPVAGGIVTFSAPASGASANLSTTGPVTIGSNGQASVTATANAIGGQYTVSASTAGAAAPASFVLTNQTTLVVNTLADDPSGPTPGYTTLRDAITQADFDTANSVRHHFLRDGYDRSDQLSAKPEQQHQPRRARGLGADGPTTL